MKVLVTGGAGFVGSALVRHLLAANYEVRILAHVKRNSFLLTGLDVEVVDGDIIHPSAVERAVQGCPVVFNLASIYTFYPFWDREASAIYKINVQGTRNMLEASLRNGVKKFVHTSSIVTISKNSNGKSSNELTEFDPQGASHYARSKYLAELEVLKFCEQGLPAVILNPGIVIGERDFKPTPSGDVIVKFLNRKYPVYFDTLWAIADADDVARAHMAAIERGRIGERYILCNKKHYSLKEIFQVLGKISGVKTPRFKIPYPLLLVFVYLDELFSYFTFRKKPLMATEGVRFCKMSIRYDNSKAVHELGYVSSPIEETLSKAVSWYRKNGYIEPGGYFRIKAGGSKVVSAFMKLIKMDTLTDKLTLGTFGFFLVVKFLELLRICGLGANKDGWRKVTECYLRTEHAKFGLTAFALDLWSDQEGGHPHTFVSAKAHVIERLTQFLERYPALHYELKWKKWSAERKVKRAVDIVEAEFDKNGKPESLKPHLDKNAEGDFSKVTAGLKSALIQSIIRNYNKTKDCGDENRPLVLKRKLDKWFRDHSRLFENGLKKEAAHFVERILSAVFIVFEKSTLASGHGFSRFEVPRFIKCKHPGFGVLNIVSRLSQNYDEADFWFQFSHIPIDGVPAQEILNALRKGWGQKEGFKFPRPNDQKESYSDLCSTKNHENGIYHAYQFLDFQPFLKLRSELNKRYGRSARQIVTSAALLLWKMAQYEEFEDTKFAVPVDLRATKHRDRTLGFIFIRPSTYFGKNKPDRGFFNFQHEFNRRLFATRKRYSAAYQLLESYALASPVMFFATSKLMLTPLKEFVGSVGLTIIKKADFFVTPFSDVHTDGFIALSNFMLPTENGQKVCVVSMKGPKEKVEKYKAVLNDIMNRAIKYDELYF